MYYEPVRVWTVLRRDVTSVDRGPGGHGGDGVDCGQETTHVPAERVCNVGGVSVTDCLVVPGQ